MKNKRYEVMLSVITIMTVLTTVVGVTFAYFTGSMGGTPASVGVTTELIGGVTFNGGSNFDDADENGVVSEIEPGWSKTKTFSITAAPSNREQTVYVKLRYTNGFTDMKCNVSSTTTNSGAKGDIVLSTDETNNQEATLVEITFQPSTETQTIDYTLKMEFPDTNVDQNAQQGKIFDGTLFAELNGGNDLYYNNENPNGTTTKPKAE